MIAVKVNSTPLYPPALALAGFFACLQASSLPAQVGGRYETIYNWEGQPDRDLFGNSVSGAGDVNRDGFDDLIVSAKWADIGGYTNAGSTFVYSGADGSILYQWHGQDDTDNLGVSVSGAGDVNADGFDDIIFSSLSPEPGHTLSRGNAAVYSGRNGTLLYRWIGTAAVWGHFGNSVADAGDVNSDGYADVIIGEYDAYRGGYKNVGSAFVFSGADGSVLFQWDGSAPYEYFGESVSGAGDVNRDGFDDLIVGAPRAEPGGIRYAGSVFVFSGMDGSTLYEWNGSVKNSLLGESASGAGDVNQDGYDDIIFGSQKPIPGGSFYTGEVSVYSGKDGTVLHQWHTNYSSVSGAGDYDYDGFDDLIIGNAGASPNFITSAGSAFIYSGADGSLLQRIDGEVPYDHLGMSVSDAGHINSDGFAEVIIGATKTIGGLGPSSASVHGFNPFIHANIQTISASMGGKLKMYIDFPVEAGLAHYKVLISASGTGPTLFGVEVPLTIDNLVIASFSNNYPFPVHSRLHGLLSPNGDALASITAPPGLPASMVGNTYFLAAVANRPSFLPEYSSVALLLTVTP
jgi:hypothetical protein